MKIRELLESSGANYNTAKQIAREMHLNIEDLNHIVASGSKIAAGNPHNMQRLKSDISMLYNELMDLGFEYDPNTPDLIRPLTIQ